MNRSSVSQMGKRGRLSQICTRLFSLSPPSTEKSRVLICSAWGKILPRSRGIHFVQTDGDKMRWYSGAGSWEQEGECSSWKGCAGTFCFLFERKSEQKQDHRRKPSLLELTCLSILCCLFLAELRGPDWDMWLLQAPLRGGTLLCFCLLLAPSQLTSSMQSGWFMLFFYLKYLLFYILFRCWQFSHSWAARLRKYMFMPLGSRKGTWILDKAFKYQRVWKPKPKPNPQTQFLKLCGCDVLHDCSIFHFPLLFI